MTDDTVADFLNRLEQEAWAQIERGFVSRVRDPRFNISSHDMARLFSLRGDMGRAEWWEKRDTRHVMPNLAFTVLDTTRAVRAETKPSLEWEDSVSDEVFLNFCEAMTKNGERLPQAKFIAKLYRLIGKESFAKGWDGMPGYPIIDADCVRSLVKEARKIIAAKKQLPHKDRQESRTLPTTSEQFLDACEKLALEGVESLPQKAANRLFWLAGTDKVTFASECVIGKEEILSYVRDGRKRLNLGSFNRIFPGIERLNTNLPLAASHLAYFNDESPKVRIVAPAVKIREKTFAIAPPVTFFDLIYYAVLNTPLSPEEFPAVGRKFLLSDGRFCSGKEALKIAIESGQYVLTDSTKNTLDFEDLW